MKFGKVSSNNCGGDLSKRWYVYFQFRHPETGKMKDFKLYSGINRYKTKRGRKQQLRLLRHAVEKLLHDGWSPFEVFEPKPNTLSPDQTPILSAIDIIMDQKRSYLKKSALKPFESRMKHFKQWLIKEGKDEKLVKDIKRSDISNFLQYVQVIRGVSNQTRNNYLTELKSLFSKLIEGEFTYFNPAAKISKLPAQPLKNRAFTEDQLEKVREWLLENDINLYFFIRWVTYAFLRPVEVCRLTLKNIDQKNQLIYVPTKTVGEKKRRIIGRLSDDLKELNLDQYEPEDLLFTKHGIPGQWLSHLDGKVVDEIERRTWFGNRFKVMKEALGFGKEYGLYSFRHVAVGDLFAGFKDQGMTDYEAKINMLPITGHATIEALEKYMREVQVEVAEDHSKYISIQF